jgi:hypothetical protein
MAEIPSENSKLIQHEDAVVIESTSDQELGSNTEEVALEIGGESNPNLERVQDEADLWPDSYCYERFPEIAYFSPLSWLRHLVRGFVMKKLSLVPIYTKQERDILDREGVSGRIPLNYLAWRKRCLITVIAPFFATILISMIKNLSRIPYWNSHGSNVSLLESTMAEVDFFLILIGDLFQMVALILTVLALKYWANYLLSRKIMMLAWTISFFSPFFLYCVPMSTIFFENAKPSEFTYEFTITVAQMREILGTLTNNSGQVDQVIGLFNIASQVLIGAYFAGNFFMTVAIQSLTLPLALIRSILTIRNIFPLSSLYGNLIKLTTVLFIPLTWTWFLILLQLFGNPTVILPPFFYSIPAIFIVCLFGRFIIPPMSSVLSVTYVSRIRYFTIACLFAAIGSLLGSLTRFSFFASYWNQFWGDFVNFFSLIVSIISRYFLTGVFGTDLILTFVADERINLEQRKNDILLLDEDDTVQILQIHDKRDF